jgi:ribosomal protein S18 acetylase RimI-like enzyme
VINAGPAHGRSATKQQGYVNTVSEVTKEFEGQQAFVRRASLSDSMVVANFARAFHAEDYHPLSDEGVAGLLAMLNPGFTDGVVLILEVDGVPAGYGVLSFCYGFEHGGPETFIEDIYVLPESRGRGFGQTLLTALESYARAAGRRAIHLEVMPGNRAETWYRRLGWRSRGSQLLTKPI